jgi:hypothetical protein
MHFKLFFLFQSIFLSTRDIHRNPFHQPIWNHPWKPKIISEIIEDKQTEDIVGWKLSETSTIALGISSTTSRTQRSAHKLSSVYDLKGQIPNESTYGYPLIFLLLPRSAKVLSLPKEHTRNFWFKYEKHKSRKGTQL